VTQAQTAFRTNTMLLPKQLWTRTLCAFVSGLVLVWLPLAFLEINAVAQTSVDVEVYSENRSSITVKDLSFSVQDYIVEHQWMTNKVNITVNYALKEDELSTHSEDLTLISNRIAQFLEGYPDEDDYWEVVNQRLTKTVFQEHPEMRSLTISLEILPRPRVSDTCISTVTVTDQNPMLETWQFLSTHIPVHHQVRELVNVSVRYTYKSKITAQEYPDFVPIQRQITETLSTSSHSLNSWETIDRQLAESVLAEHPALTDVTLELEVLPTSNLNYAYTTSVSMKQPQT